MNSTKLSKFKFSVTNILIFLVVLENIFFFELVNVFASLVLLLGWLLVKTIVLTDKNMKFYPVSFIMLLMLALFHYVLPIPLTILEWKPVTYNMNMPYETFAHHLYFIFAIVCTHRLYTNNHFSNNVFRSVLQKTSFYSLTTDRQIWISAFFGLIAMFYIYFVYGQWQSEVSDRTLMYYIATLFSQFVWMPLIIPFYKLRNIQRKKTNSLKYIIGYSFLVGIIALASNMRTLLFSGVMIIVFLFLIGILFNYYNLKDFITTKKILIISILLLLISGPLTDLAYTMVIVRNDRYNLSTSEFIEKTISVYQDKEGLNKMKNIVMSEGPKTTFKIRTWDEGYLDNILLNRFCNLKISDNCIYFADKIGYSNIKMQNELFNQIAAFTPNVLLDLFNIDFSKKLEYSSYSLTDYLYSTATNDPNVKGSFVLGSMPGLGMAIFGYWYLIILVPIFIIIFSMFDSFVKIVKGRTFFSYFFFVMILTVVNYFNNRHVFTFEIRYIFRTYIESIVVFIILMKIIRGIEIILFKKEPYLK